MTITSSVGDTAAQGDAWRFETTLRRGRSAFAATPNTASHSRRKPLFRSVNLHISFASGS